MGAYPAIVDRSWAFRVDRDIGAVAGSTVSCPEHRRRPTELLALDVYNNGGRQITLGDVEGHLRRIRGHPPACPCGRCSAAAIVRPDRVLMHCAGVAGVEQRGARMRAIR